MNIITLVLSILIISGCASLPSIYPNAFKYFEPEELSNRYEKREVGKVEIFTGQNFNERSNVHIYSTDLNVNIGYIGENEGYVFYLPENSYRFWLSTGTTKLVSEVFDIKGGETITYRWDKVGQKPIRVSSMPNEIKVLSKGSPYYSGQLDARLFQIGRERQPKFEYKYNEPTNGNIKLTIKILSTNSIQIFQVNGIDKMELLDGGNYVVELFEKVKVGYNDFQIKIVNKQGYEAVEYFNVRVYSEKEKIELAENARLERLKIEREALAKKLEEERIAKEGDGSPDDLLCKKYGLKPQTYGYAECRMRVDFAKAESKRQQQQYEREQAEYERQLAAIETEKQRMRGFAFLELSSRMLGGQSPIDALGSLGTGAPIAPIRPSPVNQTIILPGGRMINCTTMGTMTNCF